MKGYNSDFGGSGGYGTDSEGKQVNGEDYNSAGSTFVKEVDSVTIFADSHSLSLTNTPNSVAQNFKDGQLDSERYYDENGNAYLDIDYTNHGNPKTHPKIPHQHKITYDEDGNMHREKKDTEVK